MTRRSSGPRHALMEPTRSDRYSGSPISPIVPIVPIVPVRPIVPGGVTPTVAPAIAPKGELVKGGVVFFGQQKAPAQRLPGLLDLVAHRRGGIEPGRLRWGRAHNSRGDDETTGACLQDPQPGLLEARVRTFRYISHDATPGSRSGTHPIFCGRLET